MTMPTSGKEKLPASDPEEERPSKAAKKHDPVASCASFQAYVDTLPKKNLHPSLDTAVQLCVVWEQRERTIIVSGNSPMSKLNQYISEAFDVGCGDFSNNLKGKTADHTVFLITRFEEPGRCAAVPVCGKQSAKDLKFKAFVDHEYLKVGHVFRGMDDGSFLDREEHRHTVIVQFCHPKLPDQNDKYIAVMLDGIMWQKAEYPRHRNTELLPRIVGWSKSDFSRIKAIEKNEKMADGRHRHVRVIKSASTTPGMDRRTDDLLRLKPLFQPDGKDWPWRY